MEPNNERKTPAGEQNELFKKQVFSDEYAAHRRSR